MASEAMPRSMTASAGSSSSHPRLSLGNQEPPLGASFQPAGPPVPPAKSTERIPTYFIWSIFNLVLVPFGILCCYFSHKVSQLKIQNRYEIANKWSKRTLVLNIMSTLLLFGVIVTVVMLRYDYDQRNMGVQINQTRTTGPFIPWQPGR